MAAVTEEEELVWIWRHDEVFGQQKSDGRPVGHWKRDLSPPHTASSLLVSGLVAVLASESNPSGTQITRAVAGRRRWESANDHAHARGIENMESCILKSARASERCRGLRWMIYPKVMMKWKAAGEVAEQNRTEAI